MKLLKLFSDESGQSMVEYAMILALLVIVAVAAVATLGSSVAPIFIRASVQLPS